MSSNFDKIRRMFSRKIDSESDGNNIGNNVISDNSPSTGGNQTSEVSDARESIISADSISSSRMSTTCNDDGNDGGLNFEETFSIPNSCPASDESSDEGTDRRLKEVSESLHPRPKIYKIACELWRTENEYVNGLKLIDVKFRSVVKKLNSVKEIVSESELFSSINQIRVLNEDLLKDLTKRLTNWDKDPGISDIMKTFGPFFKTYTMYVSDYEKANTLLQETINKHPEFAKAVTEFQEEHCKNLAISSYMLTPIQRIPRYRLMMEDYVKHLTADSEELGIAKTALASIEDAANKINQNMKIGDNLRKILKVQERIRSRKNFNLVTPSRIYLKEGALDKVSRREIQSRVFFLFSDMLLYTEPEAVTHSLRYKDEFDLINMQVTIPVDQNLYGENFGFQINHKRRRFILKAKSIEERDEWVKDLQKAIDDARFRLDSYGLERISSEGFVIGRQAPLMVADDHVTQCQLCDKKFTIFFRRHHCRACGKVVCFNCCNNKVPLEYKDYGEGISCDPCYQILLCGLTDRINQKDTPHFPILLQHPEKEGELLGKFRKLGSRSSFKIYKKNKRLSFLNEEVNDTGSMKGQVEISYKGDYKVWKKKCCIVRNSERVMYIYDAVEDSKAAKEIPLIGWTVEKKIIAKEDDGTIYNCIIEITHFNQSSPTSPSSPSHNANQIISIRPPADKVEEWFYSILFATQLVDPRNSLRDTSTNV